MDSSVPEQKPTEAPVAQTTPVAPQPKSLVGVKGWLLFYVIISILAGVITIFGFFQNGFVSSQDIQTLNDYHAGLGSNLQALTGFENIVILAYLALLVVSIVFIFMHKKIGKTLAIVALAFSAVYGIVDLIAASSIFASTDLGSYVQEELTNYGKDVAKNVIGAAIWIPYFLVSKRVKATLTR